MRVLVTGGAGYIGSVVSSELINRGHEVIVVDNLQEGNEAAVPPEAIFYQNDFGSDYVLGRIFADHAVDAVFHLAAETTIETSMTDPGRYFENNMVKGVGLLNQMLSHGVKKIIFSSTAAVFGEPEYVPIDEGHPKAPINAYGESKLMFERILVWYSKAYGLMANGFRYFNAAGATASVGEAHRHESHLIPTILKTVLQLNTHNTRSHDLRIENPSPKLKVFGGDYPTKDGSCVRDYVHVEDIAQAHILALENVEKNPIAFYNLGNNSGFTNFEVIKSAERVTGKKIPYEIAPRRAGDPATLVASSALAKKELGWSPKFQSLDAIVETAWKWMLKHPSGYGSSNGNEVS